MRQSISETSELAKVRAKARKAAPSAEDIRRETGARIEYKENGDWVAHVPKDQMAKGVAMMQGPRSIKLERDRERQAKREKDFEKVVTRDGRVVGISPAHVDMFKNKRGLRPVGRNGVSAALRFGLNQAFEKYEQGPDGLWFVWNDGWEATNLFRKASVQSPQKDPDGNVWVERDNEWFLEDEVA